MSVIKEFAEFLKEYNVISLAVGFVMGAASTDLVKSLVNDIVMPLLSPFLSAGEWKDAAWDLGSAHIAYGSFLAAFLNFLILAIVIFFVVQKLLKLSAKK